MCWSLHSKTSQELVSPSFSVSMSSWRSAGVNTAAGERKMNSLLVSNRSVTTLPSPAITFCLSTGLSSTPSLWYPLSQWNLDSSASSKQWTKFYIQPSGWNGSLIVFVHFETTHLLCSFSNKLLFSITHFTPRPRYFLQRVTPVPGNCSNVKS